MKITLITNSQIIEKIFTLVAAKLEFELIVANNNDVELSDIIIVDDAIENIDKLKILKLSSRLGLISNKSDTNFSFIIPKPFLPSQLIDIVNKQLTKPIESISIDKNDQDESIITSENLDVDGGILNNSDIVEIQNILTKDEKIDNDSENLYIDEISDIIDNVIKEINTKEEQQ